MPVVERGQSYRESEASTSGFMMQPVASRVFGPPTEDTPHLAGRRANQFSHKAEKDISEAYMRAFDILVSVVAILVFLPLLLLLALMISCASPGPVLFCQQRVGRGGVMFPCLKFRTMVVDAKARLDQILAESSEAREEWARDQKLRHDPRVTWIGQLLRKTSLDELPQLFNILAGQMSIVGPRPIVQNEIGRYGARFPDYCSVRPGLTGLWQISGRNDVSYAMRVRLDSFYAHRRSLTLNIGICFRTIPALMTSRGCY